MKVRARRFLIVSIAIISATVASIYSAAQAEEAYTWTNGALSSKILASSVSAEGAMEYPYCESGEKYRYVTNPNYTPYNAQDQYLASKVSSNCWRTAGGWTFGGVAGIGNVFLRQGSSIGFTSSQSQEEFHGDSIVNVSNHSGDFGSSAKMLTFVNKPSFSITKVNDAQEVRFNYLPDNYWRPKDSSGDERIYSYSFSLNDKWLVYQGENGMYRLNLDTKVATLFSYPRPVSGNGVSYDLDLSITDDGRYAVLSGADNLGGVSSVQVYDIDSCKMTTSSVWSDSEACMKRDIKSSLNLSSASDKPINIYFTPQGDQLIFLNRTFTESDGTVRYIKRSLGTGSTQGSMRYLALGDSYSSGEGDHDGVRWYLEGTDGDGQNFDISKAFLGGVEIKDFPYQQEKCHQSKRSYPYLLSSTEMMPGALSSSLACSGSRLNDLLNVSSATAASGNGYMGRFEQFSDRVLFQTETSIAGIKSNALDSFFPGRVAQIEFVKKYRPQVVTVGIGGNDLGFASKLKSCIVPEITCAESTSLRSMFGYEIRAMYSRYTNLFRQLKAASMTTKVYAVGYPQFISDNPGCQQISVWLDDYEKAFMRESVGYLNKVLKAAATNSGVVYLDVENALQGKQLCDSVFSDTVNAVTAGDDQGPISGLPITNLIGNESFHPTNVGHKLIANRIRTQLGGVGLDEFNGCLASCVSVGIPAVPNYFTDGNYQYDATVVTQMVDGLPGLVSDGIEFIDFAKGAVVDTSKAAYDATVESPVFKQFTNVKVTFFSNPVDGGYLSADGVGLVRGSIPIPSSLPYGLHTLVLSGTSETNEPMIVYKEIYIYKTLDDLDGNNIPDSSQKCGVLVPAANQDKDNDGVDDACDSYINPDTTAPVVTGKLDVNPNSTGWLNRNAGITWSATDDTDGSNIAQPASALVDTEGEHTYMSSSVCDKAGNCATGSLTAKLDKTAPKLGAISWSMNPKQITQVSQMSIPVSDQYSGIARVEYYIGDTDPGRGDGATMSFQEGIAVVENTTDYQTGVYKMTVRALDKAGNWSESVSGYLVVYDPSAGVKVRGAKTIQLTSAKSNLPWITAAPTVATFGISVKYDNEKQLIKQSDFQIAYKSSGDCKKIQCHSFELNAVMVDWLVLNGANKTEGIFSGKAILRLDGVSQQVKYIVHGIDGERVGDSSNDTFSLELYAEGATTPYQTIYPTQVQRGTIKVSDR